MAAPRELRWIASCLKDLKKLPEEVRVVMGYALYLAELGDKHPSAKPLQGFGGGSVLEVVEDHDGDTYRAVYTVKFDDAVYALHAFQKKSKRGSATPQADIDLIKSRLKLAEADHLVLRPGRTDHISLVFFAHGVVAPPLKPDGDSAVVAPSPAQKILRDL